MILDYAKGLSPQGRKIYSFLQKGGTLTARKLATLLQVHPSAIYRLARYLVSIGLIKEIPGRPIYFRALPSLEAKGNYFAHQKDRIENIFSDLPVNSLLKITENYQISFIQEREAVFARVAEDLKTAKKKAHFIVLGLPIGVSPELMLEQKNAAQRGVPVKIIVQEVSDENKETISSWKKQGLLVRGGHPIGFHLLLIDDSISYLMYYDQIDKTKRYAVRILHSAINSEMQVIFKEHWKKSVPFD